VRDVSYESVDPCSRVTDAISPVSDSTGLGAHVQALSEALTQANDNRRRAECSARIQSSAAERALDLLVREPDINGFFRVFIKELVAECESRACGVWLLDGSGSRGNLWMAYADDKFFTGTSEDPCPLAFPREEMTAHLVAYEHGWTDTIEYSADDPRLPQAVREFNRTNDIDTVIAAPLALPGRTLGWVGLLSRPGPVCEGAWRREVLDAMARQATLALHQSRLAEQSRLEARRQAVLEERNGIARDIHDTLTQGFAAILMQLQAAQRSAPSLPQAVARNIDLAIDLARTHMVEARRSVRALRPQSGGDEDVAAALERMTQLARRTTETPIELAIEALPPLGGGVEREIIGIAQEALTNAVRHARAQRIRIHASSVRSSGFRLAIADDGRGIAKEHHGGGFGMTSMQERAERIGASLTIVTAPRAGTEVVLAWEPPSFTVPVRDHAAG
jgi:signal transduction histidine kinase